MEEKSGSLAVDFAGDHFLFVLFGVIGSARRNIGSNGGGIRFHVF
jgi:hypothetical protein